MPSLPALPPRPAWPLTRRRFLLGTGAAAGALVLGACGDDDADTTSTSTSTAPGGLSLVQFFGGLPMLAAGSEIRAPFGLADADGLLPIERTPDRLEVVILDADGETVVEPVEVVRYGEGLPNGYFPLRFTVDEPGIYTGRTEVDGVGLEMAMKVDAAGDVTVVQAGAELPALVTPTTADAHGVDPVCTQDPACPLHDATVAEVIEEGRPLALLVATPLFCQIAICGPVLDVLLGVADAHPDVAFLHVEVYAKPADGLDAKAPAIDELGLTFEPCLFLVGADGRVAERLDTIFDEVELGEALARLA